MEKSIERIWKDGFLKHDALVAPKLNDLYNQKSNHAIDKFKRMGILNLYGIGLLALFILISSFVINVPYAGAFVFLLLIVIIAVGIRQAQTLNKIDNGSNSYQYLKAFDTWLKASIDEYARIYRFIYPLLFLAIIIGFAYSNLFDRTGGVRIIDEIMNNPDTYLFHGFPVVWMLGLAIFIGLIIYFNDMIYRFDLNSVYGRIFKKLDELLKDMEELRA